jgi:hypothetical protein
LVFFGRWFSGVSILRTGKAKRFVGKIPTVENVKGVFGNPCAWLLLVSWGFGHGKLLEFLS